MRGFAGAACSLFRKGTMTPMISVHGVRNHKGGIEPRLDESRKIIEREELERRIGIQCGECGCEYEQPALYPYRFCAACGAPFAAEDEIIVELPWLVS